MKNTFSCLAHVVMEIVDYKDFANFYDIIPNKALCESMNFGPVLSFLLHQASRFKQSITYRRAKIVLILLVNL